MPEDQDTARGLLGRVGAAASEAGRLAWTYFWTSVRQRAPITPEYVSQDLFHFVGRRAPEEHEANYAMLQKVVASSCITYPPHVPPDPRKISMTHSVDLTKRLLAQELIVPSITCFADIPFDKLGIHTAKYGSFGLSFSRKHLVEYGARPVFYFPVSHREKYPRSLKITRNDTTLSDIEAVFRGWSKLTDSMMPQPHTRTTGTEPKDMNEAVAAVDSLLENFLAYIKPFDPELLHDHDDNFYMEREWRSRFPVPFKPEDVCKLVVHESFMKRAVADFPALKDRVYAPEGGR